MVQAMGIKSFRADGNNVKKCYRTFLDTKKYVDFKKKPVFLEFETYRHLEHCGPNNDDVLNYRGNDEILRWKKKDPIINFEKELIKKKLLNQKKIYLEKNKIKKIVNSAFSKAERSSFPNQKEAFRNLYA